MVVQKAVELSGLQPLVRSADPLVEITEVTSVKTGKHYVYVLNFSDKDQKVALQRSMKEFNSGKEYSTELMVPATDYLLLNL